MAEFNFKKLSLLVLGGSLVVAGGVVGGEVVRQAARDRPGVVDGGAVGVDGGVEELVDRVGLALGGVVDRDAAGAFGGRAHRLGKRGDGEGEHQNNNQKKRKKLFHVVISFLI